MRGPHYAAPLCTIGVVEWVRDAILNVPSLQYPITEEKVFRCWQFSLYSHFQTMLSGNVVETVKGKIMLHVLINIFL